MCKEDRAVALHLCTSKTEVADALTKALPRSELIKFRNVMLNHTPETWNSRMKQGHTKKGMGVKETEEISS